MNHTPIDVDTLTDFWQAALTDENGSVMNIPVSGPDPSVLSITVGPKDILMIVSVLITEPPEMTSEEAANLPWRDEQQSGQGNRKARRRGRGRG